MKQIWIIGYGENGEDTSYLKQMLFFYLVLFAYISHIIYGLLLKFLKFNDCFKCLGCVFILMHLLVMGFGLVYRFDKNFVKYTEKNWKTF